MKIKICGLREEKNMADILHLGVDFVGLIFYPKSARYVGDDFDSKMYIKNIPSSKKVGVFVNEEFDKLLHIVNVFHLEWVQLHGDESPEYSERLQAHGLKVIKAFGVDDDFDFKTTETYTLVSDYFLFDAKGKERGGNGITFGWEKLNEYQGNTPFFLSGGLSLENLDAALSVSHPQLAGLDFNSQLEISPGIKDIPRVNQLMNQFKLSTNNYGS